MNGHVIICFNHGVVGLAENPARGPDFFRQNPSGYALATLTLKASPLGWLFSQAEHPMNIDYNLKKLHRFTHVSIQTPAFS